MAGAGLRCHACLILEEWYRNPTFDELAMMNEYRDPTRPVRPGEELNQERLKSFLTAHVPGLGDELIIEQFPHGHSNLTYLLRSKDQEWVLRRPPFGNVVKTAHDMGREYRVLSKLSAAYECAPRPLAYCDDGSVLAAPFYVMERKRGIILRKEPTVPINPPTARKLCESMMANLARIHALDFEAIGLGDLGKPDGYVARQVNGWIKRYRDAQTDQHDGLECCAGWLTANMPKESGAALIHNDYKHDNLILDPCDLTRIIGVLDWEMCTIGDPLMDLGTTLGYWVEASDAPELRSVAIGPSVMPGSMTRQELVECYAAKSGRTVSNGLFYYAYGLFKVAVIIQQIYARFVRGHTRDERFARLNERVAILSREAQRAIDTGAMTAPVG